LPKCQYEYKPDPQSPRKFACNEPSITNSKFCIFHDKDHYAEHEQEAAKRFEEKVSDSIHLGKPLECIGYYLPHVDFERLLGRESFAQAVYFNGATFYQGAYFNATFSEKTYFYNATFSGPANFSEATFSKQAIFMKATFKERVYFSRATFNREASFIHNPIS
jgi:uncharacterized protein YjbI with pentapeptide repeats